MIMDFASQLANLERNANSARNGNGANIASNSNNSSDRRRTRSTSVEPLHGRNTRARTDTFSPPRIGQRRGQGASDNHHRQYNHRHNSSPNYQDNRTDNRSSDNRQQRNHCRQSRPPPLESMVRFGYNVAPFPNDFELKVPSFPLSESGKLRSIPHLCLLAISIDDLPYEHIWKHWANDSNSKEICFVSLVCHAKYPEKVKSAWLKSRLLLHPPIRGRGKNTLSDPVFHTRRPEWGSPEITRAMIDLVHEGLRIGNAYGNDSKGGISLTETGFSNEVSIADLEESDPRYSTKRFLIANPQLHANDTKGSNFISAQDKDVADNRINKETERFLMVDIPPVDKFIFISETCLPVQTLKECCDKLFPSWRQEETVNSDTFIVNPLVGGEKSVTKENTESIQPDDRKHRHESGHLALSTSFENTISWVNACNRTHAGTPKNKYESDQFAEIDRVVPGQYRWKADQWLVLSRIHADAIIRIDGTSRKPLWKSFANINASDEMYFPTALALLGILSDEKVKMERQVDTSVDKEHELASCTNEEKVHRSCEESSAEKAAQVLRQPVTFTDWSQGMRNPALFTTGLRDFLWVAKKARDQGSIFARKFALWPPSATIRPINDPAEDAPGYITLEQWDDAINKLSMQETESIRR